MPLWSELTHEQFMKASRETDVAVMIAGALEAHGLHLALGTDSILPDHLGRQIANRTKALVLPVMPFGDSWAFDTFEGTVSIAPVNLINTYTDIMDAIFRHGFRYIVALNGHGGNVSHLQQAAKRATKRGDRFVIIVNWWSELAKDARASVLETPEGHSAEDETSEMMHVAPEFVDMKSAKAAKVKARFRIVSAGYREDLLPYAMHGDPSKATPEKGKAIMEEAIEDLVSLIEQLEDGKLPIEET